MPLFITWREIALRLGLAAAVGALLGLERGEHGHPAGLRTTLLVSLAAAVAMTQANLLLATGGRSKDAFATLDLMRLPLGILTGMGFIGAGAILRRDGFVVGVTTAATLWFVTVVGLCFGGGQLALGGAAAALGFGVISGLRGLDDRVKRTRFGTLSITSEPKEPSCDHLLRLFQSAGFAAVISSIAYVDHAHRRQIELALTWRGERQDLELPRIIEQLSSDAGVVALRSSMR